MANKMIKLKMLFDAWNEHQIDNQTFARLAGDEIDAVEFLVHMVLNSDDPAPGLLEAADDLKFRGFS